MKCIRMTLCQISSCLVVIFQHINELSMKINLEQMLIEAEKLCLQLKEVRHLPDDVTEILTGKPVEKHEKRHFPGKVSC